MPVSYSDPTPRKSRESLPLTTFAPCMPQDRAGNSNQRSGERALKSYLQVHNRATQCQNQDRQDQIRQTPATGAPAIS